MVRKSIFGMAVLLAGLGALLGPGPGDAAAQEGRKEKVRRLVEKLGYPEWLREIVREQVAAEAGGDPKKVEEGLQAVKWEPLLDWVAVEMEKRVDDATLDEVLPYLDTPEGKRHLALVRLERSRMEVDLVLALGPSQGGSMDALMEGFMKSLSEATGSRVRSPLLEAREASNETAAIATLRNLCTCQAQMQTCGKIDCDADGVGEHGTFLELTGASGVRKAHFPASESSAAADDFSVRGRPVNPAIMSPALAGVDGNGVVTKSGYCFRIYLPDSSRGIAGFVHEAGPAATVSLAGGTGKIGIDMAETTWCAYAWPVERGVSGNRTFFVNQAGDVMQSANDVAQWSGPAKGPPGHAAFLGQGITAQVAVGTRGQDGDVWKVLN